MGQLRDWWPSEDAIVKRSSATPLPLTHSFPPLQLVEAAAALNDDEGPSSSHNNRNYPFVSPFASQACPPSPIKLINSQDHKQELLRNLLNQPPANLPQHAQPFSPSSPDNSLLNPSPILPGSYAHLLQQVHSKSPPSLSQQDDMSVTLFGKGTPSPSTFTSSTYQPSDDSLKLERASGAGGALEAQQRPTYGKHSLASEKVHHYNPIRKEALTSEISHNLRGSLYKDGVEKSCSSQSAEKHREKMHNLHMVQEHTINKESLSRREIHIHSERQRRKGMTHLYTTLLSLLPEAKPKTDRCKVLTDAIDYIQVLREQVEVLGSQKAELIGTLPENEGDHHNTDISGVDVEAANSSTITCISDEAKEEILSSADVAVRFCGREAFITLNSCKSKGVWSGILQILHEQELDIFNVTLSSGNEMDHHCIHARIPKTLNIQAQQVEKLLQNLILNHTAVD